MSYSFSISAASKVLALAAVAAELDKVVEQQPVHAADRPQAQAAAEAFIALAREPGEGEEISVGVHGSLGWHGDTPVADFTYTNVGVGVAVQTKRA